MTEPVTRSAEEVLRALHPEVTIDGATAAARFHPLPEHRGNRGWVHGGLAATVLDHVCARAAAAAMGTRVVTGRLDLRYPRPVRLDGGPYLVEAMAERPRSRMVRVKGAIVGEDGRRLVEAQCLFVALPPGAPGSA